jgi:hypothetical protein
MPMTRSSKPRMTRPIRPAGGSVSIGSKAS